MTPIFESLCWAILLGIPAYALRRGSATTLCLGICLGCFGIVAATLGPALADVFPLGGRSHAVAAALWMLWLFLPLCMLAFPAGHFLNRFILFHIEPFDGMSALLLGGVIAVCVVRMVLSTSLVMVQGRAESAELSRGFLVRQVVQMEGWSRLNYQISHFSTTTSSSTAD